MRQPNCDLAQVYEEDFTTGGVKPVRPSLVAGKAVAFQSCELPALLSAYFVCL